MGWNAKTTHAAYAVAPGGGTPAGVPADAEYLQHLVQVCDGSAEPVDEAEEALRYVAGIVQGGVGPEDPHGPPAIDLPNDPLEQYAMFAAAVADALATQDQPHLAYQQQLQALCAQYFADTSAEDLEAIASAAGFEYPMLIGLSGRESHPLAAWLDPSQSQHAEAKKKIQTLAQARFAALCAGQAVGGMTLAEWNIAPETQILASEFGHWNATAADIARVQESWAAAADAIAGHQSAATADEVAALVRFENRLATAQSVDDPSGLAASVAAVKLKTDDLLSAVSAVHLSAATEAGLHNGTITSTQLEVLNAHQALSLLRATTPAAERSELTALAAQRAEQVAVGKEVAGAAAAMVNGDTLTATAVGELVGHLHTLAGVQASAATWDSVEPVPLSKSAHQAGQAQVLEWAAGQSLSNLRVFVTKAGLLSGEQADAATKSNIAKLLSGHMSASTSAVSSVKQQLKAKVTAKVTKPIPAPAPTPPPMTPRGSFGQQHAQLVAALRHAQAAHTAVPRPLDPSVVVAWDFGAGQPANLGGIHPKSLHTGPDGGMWIAKGEGTPRGGAVTHAEAAASRLAARAGLPAVPVYATTIEGKPVSVQPMLTGAKPMSGGPSSWSQADVDEVVRLHVASWALGNHDPHKDNVLRTSGGGLVPIDQGQSFKYFGRDKLTLGYRPNPTPAVYHGLYDAHLNGTLPKEVRVNPAVAHSVISRIEAVPDAEWRAMLHTAAHAGAAQSAMKWVPSMRKRAATQHGIPEAAVTTHQIAESFLDFAVERKKNLRQDFITFFTDELKLPNAAALQHLGKT
ncbi:hypothetical protein ILP97_18105 [Amycolatopsis sp. H6(2020)]|nr:hypothetical protein [Amycolatopsis sp. H6(2020)]